MLNDDFQYRGPSCQSLITECRLEARTARFVNPQAARTLPPGGVAVELQAGKFHVSRWPSIFQYYAPRANPLALGRRHVPRESLSRGGLQRGASKSPICSNRRPFCIPRTRTELLPHTPPEMLELSRTHLIMKHADPISRSPGRDERWGYIPSGPLRPV